MNYKDYITSIEGFPREGITFRDITTFIGHGEAFRASIKEFSEFAKEKGAEVIVGPESRGFIFGAPVACELGIGFVPVRKPGKLPREVVSCSYELEYGTNTIEIHKDAIQKGQKVVIVDDLLATGGTTEAAVKLIESLGGEVVGIAFLIELADEFDGRGKLKNYPVLSLIKY